MAPDTASAARRRTTTSTTTTETISLSTPTKTTTGGQQIADIHDKNSYEFGGPLGALGIMAYSHVMLYYVYWCLHYNNGAMWVPSSYADVSSAVAILCRDCAPTLYAVGLYLGFLVVEALFASFLPGLDLLGRPDDAGNCLVYRCNGLSAWYVTLACLAGAHFSGVFPLTRYYAIMGNVMTVAIFFGDFLAAACYVYAILSGRVHRIKAKAWYDVPNHLYDFFMGAALHPRIGLLDIKFFAEIRISWYLLFINTLSCAAQQQATTGSVSGSMYVLILAHFLYANACAKGEHYVPPTWDMFYEKFGWMLSFWNFAGVPFLYCLQSVYLVKHDPHLPSWFLWGVTVALLTAYYFWDTSQSQKNHFRLEHSGTDVRPLQERWTFPRLPRQVLVNPQVLKTKRGTPLLVDGWWKYARKVHYTCDITMALCWGLVCGFQNFLPYFYVCFFVSMIVHRYQRDMHACAAKYGQDWIVYCKKVPYAFIPGII
jgi:delta24(24(1))-sterol reductase